MLETQMTLAYIQAWMEFFILISIISIVGYLSWCEAVKHDTMQHPEKDKLLDDPEYLCRVNDGNAWRKYWLSGRKDSWK